MKSHLHVVGAAIIQHRQCLVAQRGPGMALAGLWEFPGGKVEPTETAKTALVREIREELGLDIKVGQRIGVGESACATRQIVLEVFDSSIVGGRLVLREHAQVRWIHAEEVMTLDWAEADRPVLPALRRLLQGVD